jgi:hypothetical protein
MRRGVSLAIAVACAVAVTAGVLAFLFALTPDAREPVLI